MLCGCISTHIFGIPPLYITIQKGENTMYETQIRNALKAAGLDEGLVNRIRVRHEDDIAGAVARLGEEIALFEGLEKAGLRDLFEKYLQSETDRRISKALTTHDEKLRQEKDTGEIGNFESGDAEKTNRDSHTIPEDQKTIAELGSNWSMSTP